MGRSRSGDTFQRLFFEKLLHCISTPAYCHKINDLFTNQQFHIQNDIEMIDELPRLVRLPRFHSPWFPSAPRKQRRSFC